MKAVDYGQSTETVTAFVATNSICQGQQVPLLWPLIQKKGHRIAFAHTSFKWANLASHNAGVTVIIVGLSKGITSPKTLYSIGDKGEDNARVVPNINAYLVAAEDVIVEKRSVPISSVNTIDAGGKPVDGGHLLLSSDEKRTLLQKAPEAEQFVLRVLGADEYTNGKIRHCLWISDHCLEEAKRVPSIAARISAVAEMRQDSPKAATKKAAGTPHRFDEVKQSGTERIALIPTLTSESREYIPAGLLPPGTIVTNLAFAMHEPTMTDIALLNSKLNFVWIASVCGKFKTDYRFSNVLGWNTFPVPPFTDDNKAELARCAENILLSREAHWPATIAELYDPEKMPDDLRAAHDRNDETLERIYIGRRFKNDTERLETLFQLYTEMTGKKKMG